MHYEHFLGNRQTALVLAPDSNTRSLLFILDKGIEIQNYISYILYS